MNFHPSMAGVETSKKPRVCQPRLKSLTEQEIETARQMREAGRPWVDIARRLGKTEYQIMRSLGHVPVPIRRRKPHTLDATDPGVNNDGFNTRKIAQSCDDLLDALHRHHVMRHAGAETERPRYMRVIRPDYSYCGSPAQMCMEGRASSGGKTKTHEGAR